MQQLVSSYVFADTRVLLSTPETAAVQHQYQQEKAMDPAAAFPYWAKAWPSAEALCIFLAQHTQLVRGKRVLEIAAGLGLPSLYVSHFAKEVVCTDYVEEPLAFVQSSIQLNKLSNISTAILDWNRRDELPVSEVLLLSDVNYSPAEFDALFLLLEHYRNEGTSIILATPQRIMAKSFIERVLPWLQMQDCITVNETDISILVL